MGLPDQLVALGARAVQDDPRWHLLLITPHQEQARALLARAGLGPAQATTLRVPHDAMPGLLNAADVGLLLRRRDPVNAAASPTKRRKTSGAVLRTSPMVARPRRSSVCQQKGIIDSPT